MITSLIFGLFYLNVNSQFELGYDVARNLSAYQNTYISNSLVYLSPYDSQGINLWGVTYLPIISDPALDYCLNDSTIPSRVFDSNDTVKKGLQVPTIYDTPQFSTLIAVAPYVDEHCGRAFADQANLDKARVLLFINNADNSVNDSAMLSAPSGVGALSYSILSIPQDVGSSVLNQMEMYDSNSTIAIPRTALNSSVARIGVAFYPQSSSDFSKLWISILAVLASFLFVFIVLSVSLNIIQLRRRQNLRERIERGEVNLESLGVSKLVVPDEILDSLPIRIYKHGEMHFLNQEERQNLYTEQQNNQNSTSGNTDSPEPSDSVTSIADRDVNTQHNKAKPPQGITDSDNAIPTHDSLNKSVHNEDIQESKDSGSKSKDTFVTTPESGIKNSCDYVDPPDTLDLHTNSRKNAGNNSGSHVTLADANNQEPKHVSALSESNSHQENGDNRLSTSSSSHHTLGHNQGNISNNNAGKEERTYNQTSCPICLEDFFDGENDIRELPCLHIYHAECIDPFLTSRSSLCPMCKVSVLPPGYLPNSIRLDRSIVRRERIIQRQNANTTDSSSRTRRTVLPNNGLEVDENEHRERELFARHFWSRPFRRDRQGNTNNSNTNRNENSDGQQLADLDSNGEAIPSSRQAGTPNSQTHAHGYAASRYQTRAGENTNRRRARVNLNNIAPRIEVPVESPIRRAIRVLFPI